jgi:choline dehydrogenase-like flavoprotein
MYRKAADISAGALLRAEVVVVGAGPLGIVTALELADRGRRVLLIESGHLSPNDEAQDLSNPGGEGDDMWHVAKPLAVRRQVGGASTMWGGRSVPFDPIDYEPRAGQPEDLWPMRHGDVAPYLERACEWCQCGRPIFNATQLPELASSEMIPGLPDGIVRTTDLERWALPTRFGQYYQKRLIQHPNIDLVTGLTCVHVACTETGDSVDHLELRGLDGEQAIAIADHYVIAAGGLETTRLLLASDDIHPDGIGNHSDHLGRWYMAHVEARVATLHLDTPPESTIYDHERDADGVYVRRRFTISPSDQNRLGLLNGVVWMVNPDLGDASHGSGILSGVYLTLRSPLGRFMLAEAIRTAHTKTTRRPDLRAHLRNILVDLVPSAVFAISFSWARFLRRGRKAPGFFVSSAANIYPLHYHGEHLPARDSRVELTDDRDSLGMRRLRTVMTFCDADITNVRRTHELIDAHLREHGVGHIEYTVDDVEAGVTEYLKGNAGYHQTGTTRISASPDDGVVDPDLQVHGISNLSISSMSVFPTSSQANPTLTGVALAVRLAEHLDEALVEQRHRVSV